MTKKTKAARGLLWNELQKRSYYQKTRQNIFGRPSLELFEQRQSLLQRCLSIRFWNGLEGGSLSWTDFLMINENGLQKENNEASTPDLKASHSPLLYVNVPVSGAMENASKHFFTFHSALHFTNKLYTAFANILNTRHENKTITWPGGDTSGLFNTQNLFQEAYSKIAQTVVDFYQPPTRSVKKGNTSLLNNLYKENKLVYKNGKETSDSKFNLTLLQTPLEIHRKISTLFKTYKSPRPKAKPAASDIITQTKNLRACQAKFRNSASQQFPLFPDFIKKEGLFEWQKNNVDARQTQACHNYRDMEALTPSARDLFDKKGILQKHYLKQKNAVVPPPLSNSFFWETLNKNKPLYSIFSQPEQRQKERTTMTDQNLQWNSFQNKLLLRGYSNQICTEISETGNKTRHPSHNEKNINSILQCNDFYTTKQAIKNTYESSVFERMEIGVEKSSRITEEPSTGKYLKASKPTFNPTWHPPPDFRDIFSESSNKNKQAMQNTFFSEQLNKRKDTLFQCMDTSTKTKQPLQKGKLLSINNRFKSTNQSNTDKSSTIISTVQHLQQQQKAKSLQWVQELSKESQQQHDKQSKILQNFKNELEQLKQNTGELKMIQKQLLAIQNTGRQSNSGMYYDF